MTWISGQHGTGLDELPILTYIDQPHLPATVKACRMVDGRFIGPEIAIGGSEAETKIFLSLWALATSDVDGLLAVGNSFGELLLCDYVGLPLDDLAYIGNDLRCVSCHRSVG